MYVIRSLLEILVIVNVNAINHTMMASIWIMKTASVDKLVEECSENIDEAKLSEIALFEHVNECVCSYTVCIVLGVIALTICIGIGAYFTYKYINRNKENVSKYDYTYHAKNY